MIKHSISRVQIAADASVTPNWLFDACIMRFSNPHLMKGKIIIFQLWMWSILREPLRRLKDWKDTDIM